MDINKNEIKLSKIILKIINERGSVAVSKMFYSIVPLIASYRLNRKNFNAHWRINFAARRLRERGWIKLNRTNGVSFYDLTPKGRMILSKHELKRATVPRPKRWDKKWRIIIFDVQERKRKYRDHMRTILKTIGLVRLQDSVWIYPFPCEDIIELAKTAYRIRRDVIYLVSQRFTGDDKLAFNFGLGLNPIE